MKVPRWPLVKLAWWLTTHEGFYSPCDDPHCDWVRDKARGRLGAAEGQERGV